MLTRSTIVVIFVVFSTAWILASDLLVHSLQLEGRIVLVANLAKGGLFVVISTTFLYLTLKKNEQFKRAAEDEQQLSTLINSMPDFVCFKDGEGRWIRVNDFGRKLYMLENIDYIGKTDRELGALVPFFRDSFEYCIKSDEEAWKAGKLTRCEESFLTMVGEQKTFDVIKVPIFYENGERKGLLTIGRDITQQKIAEALLLKKEKLSVLGELAAGIAHEVRNPLTSINGFIQMMKQTKHVEEKYVDIMLDELERINQIVSELLVLGKPQSQCYKPLQLCDVLDYVLKLVQHEAALSDVNIMLNSCSSNLMVYGDKSQLIQVFLNIIKNSLEAMPDGGLIDLSVKEDEDRLKIEIRDTGIGIPEDRLEKIGEPFFTLKEKGMGLGLTISTKIIQEHKGVLDIQSELGKGTTVSIILPRYSAN